MLNRLVRVTLFISMHVLIVCSLSSQNPAEDFEITLRRTACYGSCPVYSLTIASDGSVTYNGKQFVRVEGIHSAAITKDEANKLLTEMLAADYFSFKSEYRTIKNPDGSESFVTDLPTTYTSLRIGSRKRSVEDYVGAPETLKKLESRIDEIAGTRKWVFIDPAGVKELASHGWNPKSKEAEAYLFDAARYGYDDVVDALLNIGVNPETPTLGSSPLQNATDTKVIRRLVAAGANVNARKRGEYGDCPLQQSAHYGSAEGVRALIDAGADFNYADEYGETVLMYAVYSGDPEKVSVLINAGADVNLKSKEGSTALSIAQRLLKESMEEKFPDPFENRPKNYPEIVKLLKSAAAK